MTTDSSNPFERYGLDPREGITAITQRLKELAEDATDEAERERIREAWEELTLHPARRLRAALFAHPETRSPLGSPPLVLRPRTNAVTSHSNEDALKVGLRELAARPSVSAALNQSTAAQSQKKHVLASLEDDPVLRGLG